MPDRIKVNPDLPEPEVIEQAAELVRQGAVIGYPTETSYGLGADALNVAARERIFAMKGRGSEKQLPVVVYGLDQLAALCDPIPASVRKAFGMMDQQQALEDAHFPTVLPSQGRTRFIFEEFFLH